MKWTTDQLKEALIKSKSYTEVLNFLGLKASGSITTIKKYINLLNLDVTHFEERKDIYKRTLGKINKNKKDLKDILVEGSTYSRPNLKRRLYKEGYKKKFVNCVVKMKIGRVKKYL